MSAHGERPELVRQQRYAHLLVDYVQWLGLRRWLRWFVPLGLGVHLLLLAPDVFADRAAGLETALLWARIAGTALLAVAVGVADLLLPGWYRRQRPERAGASGKRTISP